MITLRDVWFAYREGEWALEDVSAQIGPGLTLVLGPNGAGKSTFLKIVAGIERPDRGTAEIAGHDLWKDEVAARREIAYVPEQPDLTPYATISDILKLVARLRGESSGDAAEALERAGLAGLGRRSVRELSMGQRRRAVLAAGWIGMPNVLILDEPLEAMDRAMREEIIRWVDRRLGAGALVLLATHEIEPFVSRAGRAIAFQNRRCAVVEDLPADAAERLRMFEYLARGSVPDGPEAP